MDDKPTCSSVDVKGGPWHQAAVGSGVVAGIFGLVVCGFLLGGWFQMKVAYPKKEEQLVKMKQATTANPKDVQLVEKVRQLDLRLREKRVGHLDFARKGAYLLLGCVTLCLVCFKLAGNMTKQLPMPQPRAGAADRGAEQVRQGRLGRDAVTVGLAVMVMVWAVAVIFWPGVDFDSDSSVGAAGFASWEEVGANWASFRGQGASGISAHTNVPDKWDGKSGLNISWKTRLDILPGFNSPIVWGDKIFISGADAEKRQVYCFDLAGGELLWRGDVPSLANLTEPLEVMKDTGFAASTMATDGRRAYAIFVTGDIAAFDFEGNLVWNRNLGVPDSTYGYASSLAMFQDKVIVLLDQAEDEDGNSKSKLMALDSMTGQMVWQSPRPVRDSWASPVIVRVSQGGQVLTCGDPWVIGYDAETGRESWRADVLGGDVAPSPIYADGKVFAIYAYDRLVAIAADGRGDVTETHVREVGEDEVPDICSPLCNGQLLWMQTSEGVLTCWDVGGRISGDSGGGGGGDDSGNGGGEWDDELERMVWKHEFKKESFQASPSLVGDKLYVLNNKGLMHIIQAGREFKELGRCELGDKCLASPAFADGRIIIRGAEYLWCIKNGQ